MLKKSTVIWVICIMLSLVMLVGEYGSGIAMIALIWMVPTLLIFVYMLLAEDWRKDNA